MATSEILGFNAEWFDPHPKMIKQYLLKVFIDTKEIEVYDKKTNKPFLKRSKMPQNLDIGDFYVGGKILLYSRQISIVDYADAHTKNKLCATNETATVLLAPDMYYQMGKILGELTGKSKLRVSKLQSFCFNYNETSQLFPLLGIEAEESLVKFWTSGMSIGVELMGKECLRVVRSLATEMNSSRTPVMWTADGLGDFFFDGHRTFATTATLRDCSCCVIRQGPVKTGDFSVILDMILSSKKFEISAIQMFQLNKTSASEFLEVYEGVMPNYHDMVSDLCLGPIIALEIKQPQNPSSDVVAAFREFVGPWDVEMAAELRPGSIRALFGKSRTENAVHVTDLAEDGPSECSYFFDILSGC